MFVEVYHGGRMDYAFTDVRAFLGARAFLDVRAILDVRAFTDVRRPASAPHAGRSVRRDP
jgi:hypothetical protein